MPAVSQKQAAFMGADLARARAGKKTKTGMSAEKLKEFASTSRKGLPAHKGPSRERREKRRKLAALRAGY